MRTSRASGLHHERGRQGLFEATVEPRRVHRVSRPVPDALQQTRVARRVEGVRRALALEQAQPLQLRIGQMKAVHRNVRDPRRAPQRANPVEQQLGQRRLARTGAAGDTERTRPPAGPASAIASRANWSRVISVPSVRDFGRPGRPAVVPRRVARVRATEPSR